MTPVTVGCETGGRELRAWKYSEGCRTVTQGPASTDTGSSHSGRVARASWTRTGRHGRTATMSMNFNIFEPLCRFGNRVIRPEPVVAGPRDASPTRRLPEEVLARSRHFTRSTDTGECSRAPSATLPSRSRARLPVPRAPTTNECRPARQQPPSRAPEMPATQMSAGHDPSGMPPRANIICARSTAKGMTLREQARHAIEAIRPLPATR
jgi:hypothetical protein